MAGNSKLVLTAHSVSAATATATSHSAAGEPTAGVAAKPRPVMAWNTREALAFASPTTAALNTRRCSGIRRIRTWVSVNRKIGATRA